ncbi:MAG: flavin reductase family protein [Thalassovita sp.]
MFYEPKDGHGLPHTPFNAIVTPRPIGWISTRSADGIDNLAPYSFFNAVAYTPPQVVFASTGTKDDQDGTKDTVANIRETGVFAVNIVSYALRDAMNISSASLPSTVDEFERAGLSKAESNTINCPYVAAAPAVLECKMTQILDLVGDNNRLVLGEVTGIHMDDAHIKDGIFDVTSYQPLSRLGYRDYSTVKDLFSLKRPDDT